ncbi:unnamed protein product [Acanthoscelides obtectus]|uniref:DDE Tnp4 domain-containing protein n=1 Tax=Acanthoscelides obtectus TaxID=200917 RepID=A0A9P0K0V2_ACAOB|nr:unnamed protein product [Acanthoscelides obtectus]CAK1657083.1 hypothetical protein AOBTE_LOCUS20111 [Acanthoscelides obtectus]
MTAFRNPTPGAEINYDKLLKQERVIIECCFGQLKCRFPILQYVCRVKLENVPKISIACIIVLHNVAKSLDDPDFELVEQDPDEDEGNHENDKLPLRQLVKIRNCLEYNCQVNELQRQPQAGTSQDMSLMIQIPDNPLLLLGGYPREYKVIIMNMKTRICLYFYLFLRSKTLYLYLMLPRLCFSFMNTAQYQAREAGSCDILCC